MSVVVTGGDTRMWHCNIVILVGMMMHESSDAWT